MVFFTFIKLTCILKKSIRTCRKANCNTGKILEYPEHRRLQMNLALIVVELCSLRTFKHIFKSTLLLILSITLFSSSFPDIIDIISITAVSIITCLSVSTYSLYVELSLHTQFVEEESIHPTGISTSIYMESS